MSCCSMMPLSDGFGGGGAGRRAIAWSAVLVLLWSTVTVSRVRGGCGQSGFCCQGKNNTCRAEGARESNNDSFTCFCDAGCMDLADCCVDYRSVCNPIDCVLSKEWTEWSECDVSCGFGSRQRTRQVLVQPGNNGRPCQPTVQKLVCQATRCRLQTPEASSPAAAADRGLHILGEIGEIIPVEYSGRSSEEEKEERTGSLLPPQRNGMNTENGFANETVHDSAEDGTRTNHERPTYCARYELTETRLPCQSVSVVPWSSVPMSSSRELTRGLTRGLTVCVECPSLAMRTHLGGRCRGHGVHQMETRWSAVTIPGCHGRWMMMTRQRPCRCRPEVEPSFVFI